MGNLRRMRRSQMNDGLGAKRVPDRLVRKLKVVAWLAEWSRQLKAELIGAKQGK